MTSPQDVGQPRQELTGLDKARRQYGFLALLVSLTFLMRYVLADRNSYWLDELYSVERYVIQYDSMMEAIRALADSSIHPPLYQSILYVWVNLVGDGETATRTLSNLYVAIAIIVFHRTVTRLYGDSFGVVATLAFALSYAAMYFGLETRSYAQTLMLSVVSSYALIAYLQSPREKSTRPWVGPSWEPFVLSAANLALLLTHYYNFFFWGAQVAFLTGYLLTVLPRGVRMRRLATAGAYYLVQLAAFVLIWGRVTLESYQRNTGRFAVETAPTNTPLSMLTSVIAPNFRLPFLTLSLIIIGGLLLRALLAARSDDQAAGRARTVPGTIYFLTVVLLAPISAYILFLVFQAERFSSRYLLYLVPGLTILLLVALRQAVRDLLRLASRLPKARVEIGGGDSHALTLTSLALMVLLVLPGSVEAASRTKQDWRGMAQEIVAIVESDPENAYVLYETAFRSTPMLDYYLARYSDEVRVAATIRRLEERRGGDFAFERNREQIEEHEFLIVPFIHHRTSGFPLALERLQEMYSVHHQRLNASNRGLIIFDVRNPARD